MPSRYIEKCARAVRDADDAFDNGPLARRDASQEEIEQAWAEDIARAVLEAGRLSECPEAIEAVVPHTYTHLELGYQHNEAAQQEDARDLLRAAEDAVLRHPCCPAPSSGPHKFSCPVGGAEGLKLPAVREPDGTIRVTLPRKP
jgi:hypothetical protein